MRRTRLLAAAAALAVALAACDGGGPQVDRPQAPGPPDVDAGAVERHARELDEDIGRRRAGSQEEFAAASYITGHLQRAGYSVRLDAVPVADTVNSSNVVAIPPGRGDPVSVVAVAYDSPTGSSALGEDVGLFLELARALRVREPEHGVAFVAWGAEFAPVGGGHLGSATYLRALEELEDRPGVVTPVVTPGGGFSAPGPPGDALTEIALERGIEAARPLTDPITISMLQVTAVYEEKGVAHAVAAGGVEEIAGVLLEHLTSDV